MTGSGNMDRMSRAPWPLLALVVALAAPASASACSCLAAPERERLRAADAAFAGTLVSRRALDPPAADGSRGTGDPFVHRYRVDRRYKGRLGRTVWVRTVRGGATCGVPARRRVALYLQRVGRHWEGSLCGTTTRRAMRAAARGERGRAADVCPGR